MKKILWLNDDKYIIFDTDKKVCWNIQTNKPNTLGGEFISRLDAFAEGYYSYKKLITPEKSVYHETLDHTKFKPLKK